MSLLASVCQGESFNARRLNLRLSSSPLTENLGDLQKVVQERLSDLVRVLKAVIGKHQTLNSADILGAAGMVIAKVKGQWLHATIVASEICFRQVKAKGSTFPSA